MAYKWENYLDFAKQLLTGLPITSDETKYRNIVSRSYYAAFHKTKIFLDIPVHTNETEFKGKSHDEVIIKLYEKAESQNNPKLTMFANKLSGLKRDRVICDYRNFKPVTRVMAENDYESSKDLCEYLSSNQH